MKPNEALAGPAHSTRRPPPQPPYVSSLTRLSRPVRDDEVSDPVDRDTVTCSKATDHHCYPFRVIETVDRQLPRNLSSGAVASGVAACIHTTILAWPSRANPARERT
jgi:hypothetical protein